MRHPAALPSAPTEMLKPGVAGGLPKPVLEAIKSNSGIMLTWNFEVKSDVAEIHKYEVYGYRRGNHPPSTTLWRKLGEVRSGPLPNACMVREFFLGEKYYFAVRGVDKHGRVGPFSTAQFIRTY